MDLQEIKTLTKELMKEHGLGDWTFRFNNAKLSLGSCNSDKKLITLSRLLTPLKDRGRIKDIILHEIAHALNRKKYGWINIESHGIEWKRIAKSINCYDEILDWTEKELTGQESPY